MKIVFISHDASRTGAPILLLRLIKALKETRDFSPVIFLFNSGELEDEFSKAGRVFIWKRFKDIPRTKKYWFKIKNKLGIQTLSESDLNKEIVCEFKDADIIFNNSIGSGNLLMHLPVKDKKVISYVHELQVMTKTYASSILMEFLKSNSEIVFVPSNAVKDFILKDYAFPREKIHFLKYIIENPKNDISQASSNPSIFKICLCGTLDWRKGYDLLPLLMENLITNRNEKEIHFTWLGVRKKSLEFNILTEDLRKLGLSEWIDLIEPVTDVNDVMAQMDLFLLLSREDAYPLVVLEAANLQIPTVCFKNSGGITEFLEDDAGIAVEYLNINAMAEAILKMKNDVEYRNNCGKKAKQKLDMVDNSSITTSFWKYVDQLQEPIA